MGDIYKADQSWNRRKVSILVNGDWEDEDGALHVERSAYELRLAAIDSHDSPCDLIIEAAQLDKVILRAISDWECRIAMLLRTRGGYDEYEIQELLKSKRPGYQLLRKGIDLVRRQQRGEHNTLLRVRAAKGESDTPVCWRCLSEPVSRPGDDCGCTNPVERKRGKPPRYEPDTAPDPATMTDEEREAEIEKLSENQTETGGNNYRSWNAQIPGGSYYVKRVVPGGLSPSPRTPL